MHTNSRWRGIPSPPAALGSADGSIGLFSATSGCSPQIDDDHATYTGGPGISTHVTDLISSPRDDPLSSEGRGGGAATAAAGVTTRSGDRPHPPYSLSRSSTIVAGGGGGGSNVASSVYVGCSFSDLPPPQRRGSAAAASSHGGHTRENIYNQSGHGAISFDEENIVLSGAHWGQFTPGNSPERDADSRGGGGGGTGTHRRTGSGHAVGGASPPVLSILRRRSSVATATAASPLFSLPDGFQHRRSSSQHQQPHQMIPSVSSQYHHAASSSGGGGGAIISGARSVSGHESRMSSSYCLRGSPASNNGSVSRFASGTGIKTPRYSEHGGATPRGLSFQRGREVGSGGFGTVFQAILADGTLAAIKELKLDSGNIKAIDREVSAMSNLPPHPNCVRYFGSRHSAHHYFIIMEYISGGSIHSLRQSVGPFRESVFQRYAYMALQGLQHLHHHGIVHRDIKGANVLLDETGCAKIVDFGCCKDLNEVTTTVGGGGTPLWMSPEVCRGSEANEKSDVWSYGCLCLEMTNATGLPWDFPSDLNLQGIAYALASAQKPPEIPSNLSPLAQDFIAGCLQIDPEERLSVAELLEHSFFDQDYLDESEDDDGVMVSREASARESAVKRLARAGQRAIASPIEFEDDDETNMVVPAPVISRVSSGRHAKRNAAKSPYTEVSPLTNALVADEPQSALSRSPSGPTLNYYMPRINSVNAGFKLQAVADDEDDEDVDDEKLVTVDALAHGGDEDDDDRTYHVHEDYDDDEMSNIDDIITFARESGAVQPLEMVLEDTSDSFDTDEEEDSSWSNSSSSNSSANGGVVATVAVASRGDGGGVVAHRGGNQHKGRVHEQFKDSDSDSDSEATDASSDRRNSPMIAVNGAEQHPSASQNSLCGSSTGDFYSASRPSAGIDGMSPFSELSPNGAAVARKFHPNSSTEPRRLSTSALAYTRRYYDDPTTGLSSTPTGITPVSVAQQQRSRRQNAADTAVVASSGSSSKSSIIAATPTGASSASLPVKPLCDFSIPAPPHLQQQQQLVPRGPAVLSTNGGVIASSIASLTANSSVAGGTPDSGRRVGKGVAAAEAGGYANLGQRRTSASGQQQPPLASPSHPRSAPAQLASSSSDARVATRNGEGPDDSAKTGDDGDEDIVWVTGGSGSVSLEMTSALREVEELLQWTSGSAHRQQKLHAEGDSSSNGRSSRRPSTLRSGDSGKYPSTPGSPEATSTTSGGERRHRSFMSKLLRKN